MSKAEQRKLHVLFAASEAAPFVKTGGLGDVAGTLPVELAHAGLDVSVILPKYGFIAPEWQEKMEHVCDFYLPLSWRNPYCGIERIHYRGIDFYFVDNQDYFGRDGAYGYFDDAERFAFFSKAVVECIQYIPGFTCDVLHCNDWQCAMAPVFLREFYQGLPEYEHIKTVFTVHNVKFQGQYSEDVLGDICGLAHVPAAASQMACGPKTVNFMKGALAYSDALTTVSPSYAQELKMPYYGEGMDGMFRMRESVLHGILNGIDMEEFNPVHDKGIAKEFSVDDLSGKAECKAALQRELGFDVDPYRPLMVMVSRLTKQKGLDLIQYALDAILGQGVQVAILGTGDRSYEDSLRYFDWKYHDNMRACIAFDPAFSHRMYAGADMFLMPSQFEPCGLSQMIAMRYGTIPIVRETGGLKDTVIPFNHYTGEGTGFSFANFNGDEFRDCALGAVGVYRYECQAWHDLMVHGMSTDFGWEKAAEEYKDVYLGLHPEIDLSEPKPAAKSPEPKAEPSEKNPEPKAVVKSGPKPIVQVKPQPIAKVPPARPTAMASTGSKAATSSLTVAPSKPAAKPAAKSAVKPAAKPAAKSAVKPAAKPAAKTAAKPVAKPAAKPAVKPVAKPAAK
ncbi:MAG: glycogen synthase GlgA, partial [Atopobiaceae bacterium]|nr:glycogen synthase GlgA [Atopobiaceae bacterium]